MYRTDFWTLWEKARVGWFERTALKHVYYQVWNRSPLQVGCMRQVLGADAPGWPRGMWWWGRWEGDSGWGTHANPWLIHVNVWQKLLQYCKVINLQLTKINEKKNSAAMNNGIHVSFSTMVSSGYMPRSGIAGSYGGFIPNFLRNLHTIFHSAVSLYIPTNSARTLPFLHTLSSIYCL